MGIQKLSHMLIDLGLFCALGSIERKNTDRRIVGLGTPYTGDYNQGVGVVYDEAGRPWIFPRKQAFEDDGKRTEFAAKLSEVCGRFPMKMGAYVPHSNDGGDFVRMILPNLLPKA